MIYYRIERLYSRRVVEEYKMWLDAIDDSYLHHRINRDVARTLITTSGDEISIYEIKPNQAIFVRGVMMWNLPKRDFEILAESLGIKEHPDLLWNIAGGNPEALISIYSNGLREFVESEIERLRLAIEKAVERGSKDIWGDIERVLNMEFPMPKLFDTLRDAGMAVEFFNAYDNRKLTEIPREPWIGKHYAFSTPLYYHTLKIMARKKSWKISPEEVIGEALVLSSL